MQRGTAEVQGHRRKKAALGVKPHTDTTQHTTHTPEVKEEEDGARGARRLRLRRLRHRLLSLTPTAAQHRRVQAAQDGRQARLAVAVVHGDLCGSKTSTRRLSAI